MAVKSLLRSGVPNRRPAGVFGEIFFKKIFFYNFFYKLILICFSEKHDFKKKNFAYSDDDAKEETKATRKARKLTNEGRTFKDD